VLQSISDRFLREIITEDPASTRFHACERFSRCDHVQCDDIPGQKEYNYISRYNNHVVYVNPVTMDCMTWDRYLVEVKLKLLNGEPVHNLVSTSASPVSIFVLKLHSVGTSGKALVPS
jgi:hypothetical protein